MLPFQKFKPRFSQLYQSGQGVIEIIVVVGISTIIILALVALSTRANQSSKNSATQDQAARYAQQGIEAIRSIKQFGGSSNPALQHLDILQYTNCDGSFPAGVAIPGFITWEDFYTKVNVDDENHPSCGWRVDSTYGRVGVVHPSACTVSLQFSLHVALDSGGDFNLPKPPCSGGTVSFSRYIYVADTPKAFGGESQCNLNSNDWITIKQFTVVVKWTNTTGDHQSVATACITKTNSSGP